MSLPLLSIIDVLIVLGENGFLNLIPYSREEGEAKVGTHVGVALRFYPE